MSDRVVLGMSGGVDSSVAALLLKDAGFDVVGVMLKLESGEAENSCCNTAAQARAARVAGQVGIPFVVVDAQEIFRRQVIEPYLEAHARGQTPNPCVRCNPFVKLSGLLQVADRIGAAYIATGHYLERREARFFRGRDRRKDQSYFLWAIERRVLERTLFPLGSMLKAEIRAIAEAHGLVVAGTPESQNLCFVQQSPKNFLLQRLGGTPGPVVDLLSGEVIGQHQGAHLYTVGQKRGLGLYQSHRVRYVVRVDIEHNTLYVGPREAAMWLGLEGVALNAIQPLESWPEEILVQIRYQARPVAARVVNVSEDALTLAFREPVFAVTPGQSAVFYNGDELLGGAIIKKARENLLALKQDRQDAPRTVGA